MSTVTITKEEYKTLKHQARAYQKLTSRVFESVLKDPISDVVQDFRKTNIYTDDFLADLENGLKKSSYAKTKK